MVHSDKKKKQVEAYGKVVVSELSDLEKLQQLFKGIDVLVHLAGMSSPITKWQDVSREISSRIQKKKKTFSRLTLLKRS